MRALILACLVLSLNSFSNPASAQRVPTCTQLDPEFSPNGRWAVINVDQWLNARDFPDTWTGEVRCRFGGGDHVYILRHDCWRVEG
jgi:hypothetical protein